LPLENLKNPEIMRKIMMLTWCFLLTISQLWAQNSRTITGKVLDEKGAPLNGVTISVKEDGKVATTSDLSGYYKIVVTEKAKSLVFTSVGFVSQTIQISGSSINVQLKTATSDLDDVVVTGYSTKKKSEFTGSSSKVSAKQLEQIPMASFDQMLQGRAPGVYVGSSSGQPGSNARVLIRGVGSLSGGTTPLYVLDGVPIEDGVFRTLNPNDFETIDVLKDAAGAGQYGSRGANGVIVITTKKGKAGKVQMQYRGQIGYGAAPSLNNLRMMNTNERLQFEEDILGGGTSSTGILSTTALTGYPGWDYSLKNPRYQTLTAAQRATEALLLDSIRQINTNWADVMFRNSKFRQHELSASGGSGNFTFFTSLSAFNQEGVLYRSNLDRYTFRANIDFKTERLTVNVRTSAGWSKQSGIESEAGIALANPIAAAFLELPYRKLLNTAGTNDVGAGRTGANAYDRIFTTTSDINQFKGNLGLTIQYKIWNGISFKTTNGIDWRSNLTSRFIDANSFAGRNISFGAQGSYNEGSAENLQLVSTSGLVYNKTINQKHTINAMAMYEAIRNKSRSFNATGYGLNLRLPNTPAAITPGSASNNMIPVIGGGKTLNGLSSTFLLADYTYDKKYTVSASVRRDAPSQVPITNRDNRFYTVGASWNIIAESFMQKQNIFQDARLRLSRGETANGNGFTSDFGYISTYGPSGTGYAGVPGIVPTSPGNADYRLESQLLTNFGLDLTFWNKRSRLTLDYYVKDSKNLFANQPLSRTTGFLSLATNAAQIRNKGFEYNLSVDVISKKDLLVTIGFNGAFVKNNVESLGTLTEIVAGTGITRVGLPVGTHFAVGWLGVDPNSGQAIYQDINGNPTNIYSAANSRTAFGTFNPTFTGGANLDISWKGISVAAFFTTAQGIQRFNNEAFFYETTNSNVGFNKRVDLLNTWTKPGDITNYQRISAQRQFSSRDIQDASFVRFRNLQIGYTHNFKNTNLGVRSFRVWAQGQNLYTWTKWQGFDPEESNNIATYEFPNPKTYTLGLDINF
jgi:TonB-linked SusC/RagA family outer membrane protein